MAVCEWLWAFALLGLCAVDLFMEETVWPSLATVLVVGVCEAIVMVYCIVTPLAIETRPTPGRATLRHRSDG